MAERDARLLVGPAEAQWQRMVGHHPIIGRWAAQHRAAPAGSWTTCAPSSEDAIDGLVALCMALERAENRPESVRLVGWL
jgi:hypothetical protein